MKKMFKVEYTERNAFFERKVTKFYAVRPSAEAEEIEVSDEEYADRLEGVYDGEGYLGGNFIDSNLPYSFYAMSDAQGHEETGSYRSERAAVLACKRHGWEPDSIRAYDSKHDYLLAEAE